MTERELLIVNAVVENLYKVVSVELQTYCSLTSRISRSVLQYFGIEAELLPCQVWLVTPEQNYVVGFTGQSPEPGKWNGHVVCSTADVIIDGALHHFKREFDQAAPQIAAVNRFQMPSQVIARLDLKGKNALWWHRPPSSPELDLAIPEGPEQLVSEHSGKLIERLSTMGLSLPCKPVTSRSQADLQFRRKGL